MKLKLKKLAVALALAASAGQASAALMTVDNGSGSELFLSVYDPGLNKSYIRDLGINMYDFMRTGATAATPGTVAYAPNTAVGVSSGNVTSSGYSLSFGLDPLLTSWMGSTLSSNALWMVGAGDGSGSQRFLTTVGSGNPNIVGNGNLNAFTNVDGYLYGNNSLTANGSNMSANLNGSAAAVPGDGVDVFFVTGIGSDWTGAQTAFLSTAKVGQSMAFYELIGNAGLNATATKYTNSAGAAAWTLATNGTLTYAAPTEVSAVPVPAAVWLFGSGLMGLVGISRRKKV